MHIANRHIARDTIVYIIAELGVNHDGSPDRLLEMVHAAAEAGADAVKFQYFRADLLLSRAAGLAGYQAAAGESDPRAMLRRLELPGDAVAAAVRLGHELGLHAIATVFSVELVDEAEALGFDAYKTASPDIINRPLLERLAQTGRPLIMSTGASTLDEVMRAVGWVARCSGRGGGRDGSDAAADAMDAGHHCAAGPGTDDIHTADASTKTSAAASDGTLGALALLQCVSCYPTRAEDAAIAGMTPLMQIPGFGGPVGYSDHTTEVDTGAAAARLGAAMLEKHFTHSRSAAGPDHAASLEPAEFRAYATLARDESQMRLWMGDKAPPEHDRRWGAPEKIILDCERDVREKSRQSLTTARSLAAGHTLARQDLTIKRPGTGMQPWRLEQVIGCTLARDVEADTPLTKEDLA